MPYFATLEAPDGAGYLQNVVDNKLLQLKGIVGIFPSNSVDDDIEVYADEDRQQVRCRFFGLRQQAEKENEAEPYMCISDFVAPKASGVKDYLGMFANATFGVEDMVAEFKADVRPLYQHVAQSHPPMYEVGV